MDSPTDVIPQERGQRSGGTLRNRDIGCTDVRSPGTAGSAGVPIHATNGIGRRKVPRPAIAALRMTSG